MDEFEQKYGFKEDAKTIAFHKTRRLFCIHENELRIAEPNVPYSHAAWFENEGWISKTNDALMDSLVRGVIDSDGDIHFYIGYDFGINKETESVFFSHLKELAEKLDLNPDAKIFGGLIRQKVGTIWPPRKEYGKMKDNL